MTLVLAKVRALVERLTPISICDDCITRCLDLSVPHHTDLWAHELAGSDGFEIEVDECGICAETRKVIRHNKKHSAGLASLSE